MKQNLNMANVRELEQEKQMVWLQKHNICPFCRKYFEAHHKAPILWEKKFWLVTMNDYPYEGSVNHFLIVHRMHKTSLSDISKKAAEELGEALHWIEKKYKLPGGTFAMRFGDIHYTGATIAHLHAHVIVGIKQSKNGEKIKFKAGFQKKNTPRT